ncbi:hypothetical protein L195_g026083 [Trifolium pratense]|uniref:DUF4283 domain-containing protein n=1 Tax=Trifolium pratense TaxID=57577 RepID=A0A2K3NI94_TRIPR|nr:hypothetical protein L195_g026083 [Trifolium pratense]
MRGRERGGSPRAYLGWPRRSPSPAKRQTRGRGSMPGCQIWGGMGKIGLSAIAAEVDRILPTHIVHSLTGITVTSFSCVITIVPIGPGLVTAKSLSAGVDGTVLLLQCDRITTSTMIVGDDRRTSTSRDHVDNPCVIGESNLPEGVKVGDVMVKLGGSQKRVQHHSQQLMTSTRKMSMDDVVEPNHNVLLRNYKSTADDVKWARSGLVATVKGGEAVPVIQNRIEDAGFNDLVIISMGADTIFVQSEAEVEAVTIMDNAKEFFKLLFSNWVKWEPGVVPFRRGAWVHLYGIPLQAWNEFFFGFALLTLEATPDLEIIKKVEKVLVDGLLVEIRIIEEWGYALGEDACLFKDDNAFEASHYDIKAKNGDQEASHLK